MLQQFTACVGNKKCDLETMCGFMAPLIHTYELYADRLKSNLIEWRAKNQHEGQVTMDRLIADILITCPAI